MTDRTHENLLAFGPGTAPTLLPADPAAAEVSERGPEQVVSIVREHPGSSLCWAILAQDSLAAETPAADVTAYAYARTGYHRGLDALRRAGWRGSGPIPWEHPPNRGFLRALWALAQAAERIGEVEEYQRCAQLLRDSSPTAAEQLARASAEAGTSTSDTEPQVR